MTNIYISKKDAHGRTPFHYVAYGGSVNNFDLLYSKLRKKSFINTEDNHKWTPLHYAAKYGNLKMVRCIIRHNGDPNNLTAHGLSILHFLAKFTPQDSKCVMNYTHTLKMCVEVGADVNQRNCDWFTPVHEASASGNTVALNFFLKNEGDPHRKTKSGRQTPLSYAVRSGNKDVVKILLDAGADPINCFDYAPEEYQNLLEDYRVSREIFLLKYLLISCEKKKKKEKNCRPESDIDNAHKEVIVIRDFDDFPKSATKIIQSSGLLDNKQLIDDNWNVFLYVLRFLTRKIYRTPGKIQKLNFLFYNNY